MFRYIIYSIRQGNSLLAFLFRFNQVGMKIRRKKQKSYKRNKIPPKTLVLNGISKVS